MNRKLTARKAAVLISAGALTLGTVTAAGAANGDNWILGVLNNTATATTRLVANLDGASVILNNSSTGANATALDLRVANGVPSMKVANNTKIAKLNSDLLDGFDQSAFMRSSQVRADGNHSTAFIDDFTGNATVATKTFSVPKTGVLVVSGSLSAEEDCSLTGRGNLYFNLRVDGSNVFSFPFEIGDWSECGVEPGNIGGSSSATAVIPVAAGSHTVELVAQEVGSGSFLTGRSISAVFLPNGSGDPAPSAKAGAKGAEQAKKGSAQAE